MLSFTLADLQCSSHTPMRNAIIGSVAIEFPEARPLPYNLLGLAMVDRLRARLFVRGGTGWTTPEEFGTTSPCVEAGFEQIVEVSTLGGLLPLSARFGVVTPIAGVGTTALYVRVSM
jgi:hypothetical protein